MPELEPASFEVERFEFGPDACLEVHGRWSGVRGRRFMRPTLTAVAGGRQHRLLAVLDHKPWVAEEGEAWRAAFPWSTDPAPLLEAELTVAPDVTVPLPPLSVGGRRRDSRSRGAPVRKPGAAGEAGEPRGRSKDDGRHDARLRKEHDAAVRAREEALLELDATKRDRDRLRVELGEALAAREAVIAERHDAIEAEVRLRIADLRAEAERERAAAGQAAQFARERDRARDERADALRERDEAHEGRDAARLERNRLLAQRDTARSQVEEATRRWEATAALGTRRTQERDAAASERDRVACERDGAAEERDRAARERDGALEERHRLERERDAGEEERDRVARERDAALAQLEQAREQMPVADEPTVTRRGPEDRPAITDEVRVAGAQPAEGQPDPGGTPSAPRVPAASARPSASQSPARDSARRPRRPPPPREARPDRTAARTMASAPSPQVLSRRDAAEMWRARLLAVAALLVALVIFVVILTAK